MGRKQNKQVKEGMLPVTTKADLQPEKIFKVIAIDYDMACLLVSDYLNKHFPETPELLDVDIFLIPPYRENNRTIRITCKFPTTKNFYKAYLSEIKAYFKMRTGVNINLEILLYGR